MKLNIKAAMSSADMLEQMGDLGRTVPPRSHRTAEDREAYCMRRWLLHRAQISALRYPLTVTHSDAPDFSINEAGEDWCLEVTEATQPLDQREWASSSGPVFLGCKGGRGGGALVGDHPETMVLSDIAKAIATKASKPYASNHCRLLLYVNSNPGTLVDQERLTQLLGNIEIGTFDAAYILFKEKIIELQKETA